MGPSGFSTRILENEARVRAALDAETAACLPAPRDEYRAGATGWRGLGIARILGPPAPDRIDRLTAYQSILCGRRRMVAFEPDANGGRGAWIELIGTLRPSTTHVGVLVPGGSAYLTDTNFHLYAERAATFVDQSGGRLAILVWTADGWPGGWLQEMRRSPLPPLARGLVGFCAALRAELTAIGSRAVVTAVGHSYGGAVVGLAESYGLDVDRVLHVASVGMGVWQPSEYGPARDRPRFSMTAPGDWIGYVQGVPWLGHGAGPDTFPGVVRLATGGGPRAGRLVAGMHAHSLVFAPRCDAWWNIYGVLIDGQIRAADPASA